jgi:hypothetical protein
MMMKTCRIGLYTFFIFFASLASAQTEPTDSLSVFRLVRYIEKAAKDIHTDRLGNLYVVTKTNQLYKYSPEGILLSTLNYKYIGNISHIDATNPLEIYVFYKELNLVVFLDNNLAYRGEMKLERYQVTQASAIARSFDNGIWAFDLADLQLKRMDKNGENLQASGNIRQFVKQKQLLPTYVFDDNNRVFLVDSSTGIMVFDVFAQYLKTIPIRGNEEVKVIGDELYYKQQQNIFKYHLKTFTTAGFRLPPGETILDLSIEKGRLYILLPGKIGIYSF